MGGMKKKCNTRTSQEVVHHHFEIFFFFGQLQLEEIAKSLDDYKIISACIAEEFRNKRPS